MSIWYIYICCQYPVQMTIVAYLDLYWLLFNHNLLQFQTAFKVFENTVSYVFIILGVEVVPGSPGPVSSAEEALQFCEQYGVPVIFKAAYGGGGRGMRKVTNLEVINIIS